MESALAIYYSILLPARNDVIMIKNKYMFVAAQYAIILSKLQGISRLNVRAQLGYGRR